MVFIVLQMKITVLNLQPKLIKQEKKRLKRGTEEQKDKTMIDQEQRNNGYPVKTNADKLKEVFGSRGEQIAYCMGFQFGLWDKWLDAPYEEPKKDNE